MLEKKKRGGMLCVIRRRALLDVAAGLEVLDVVDAAAEVRRPRVDIANIHIQHVADAVYA